MDAGTKRRVWFISPWYGKWHQRCENISLNEICASRNRDIALLKPSRTVGDVVVQPSSSARNLGVYLDDQLDTKQHITNT